MSSRKRRRELRKKKQAAERGGEKQYARERRPAGCFALHVPKNASLTKIHDWNPDAGEYL